MQSTHYLPSSVSSDRRSQRLSLLGFVVLLAAAGAGLGFVAGGPAFPPDVPTLDQVPRLLAGDTLPLRAMAVVLVDFAWAVYAWVVASLALELAVVAAESAAFGAGWVRSLRRIADRVTVPLVRHTVAAAFVVQVLGRGVSVAHAQALPAVDSAVAVAAQPAPIDQPQTTLDTVAAAAGSAPTYLVRRGDTLWSIADRAYGSGTAYRRLVAANVGRQMVDGQIFSAHGVIKPGWQLVVPDAITAESVDGQRWYTVQAGDTLSSIAAVLCGDESRWSEIFALNHGATSADGSGALSDANVIWPGLRLQLPLLEGDPSDEASPPDTAADGSEDALVAAHAVSATPSPEILEEPAGSPEVVPIDSRPPVDAPVVVLSNAVGVDAADVDSQVVDRLVRTPHALQPIVLEPADLAAGEPDATTTPPDAEGRGSGGEGSAELPIAPVAAVAAGLMTAAGAAAVASRRLRRLRRLPQERESDVVVEGGFAAAQLGHDLNHGLDGAEFDPLSALLARVQHFLREYGLVVRLVSVRSGRSAVTLTLAANSAEQALVIDLAPALGAALAADLEAGVSIDQDVVLRISRRRKTQLIAAASDVPNTGPRLLPLGVLHDRQTFAVAWDSVGHLLVASLPGHGADTILTSLVAALTARHSPEQLHVWMMARPRALPSPLFDLPHVQLSVDPDDQAALVNAVEQLRAALDDRAMRKPKTPDLVVVIPELAALGAVAADLELLAAGAVGLGVRFLGATTTPRLVLDGPLFGQFGTRLVLRMEDEESSVGLLGVADAAFLGGGGRLLVRIDGRTPVELYGYQVAPEHLERLARVMRSAYTTSPQMQPSHDESASAPLPENGLFEPPRDPPGDDGRRPDDAPAGGTSESVSNAGSAPGSTAPPLTVICFGGPRVLCAGRQIWPRRGGGDAKPWEFLLYLACQPPEGAAAEDAVEALWPEDDADNAAHRFRQLRYRLRQVLAAVPGGPQTDGIFLERGTFKLDASIVHSDAREFLHLIRGARAAPAPEAITSLERARALYLGDLLEGPDARRYAWVDDRDGSGVTLREHFRKQFQLASTQLAELYAERGAYGLAIEVYRELTEIDAADERLWGALFRLHADRGDRQALVREEQRLRQAWRELGADGETPDEVNVDEPSRDLVEEYQRLLNSLADVEPEVARVG